MAKLVFLPGDGIGIEISHQAKRVLEWFNQNSTTKYEWSEALIGGAALDAVGEPLPQTTLEQCKKCDAVLLGAVGGKKWETDNFKLRPETGLLALRKGLGLYANLRPAKLYAGSASSLRSEVVAGLDILIVRELTGGIYFGEPRGITTKNGEKYGFNTLAYSESEIERIVRLAFELAQTRSKKLCSVDKANVLEATMLWRQVATGIAKDFPDVELTHMYVDNAAMQLISNPRQFDVMVTTNMFGDILSDGAAAVVGSLGLLPSASLGDGSGGSKFGLYEPIHGSAPDIAGKQKANPTAMLLSLAMAFRHSLADEGSAQTLEKAVEETLQSGKRTADISEKGTSPLTTEQFTNEVIKQLEANKK